MTGEEMERAIEFLLQSQATVESQVAETNRIKEDCRQRLKGCAAFGRSINATAIGHQDPETPPLIDVPSGHGREGVGETVTVYCGTDR